MALEIGIRSGIPLIAAYSDFGNRFFAGISVTGEAIHRSLYGKGQFFILQKVQNNVSSLYLARGIAYSILMYKSQMPFG